MQEPDIPPLFQTISKEESPLSFFGDEVPAEAISDKRDYRNKTHNPADSPEPISGRRLQLAMLPTFSTYQIHVGL
jgi:hypothetical protein